ncbi:MAG: hypothetical protein L0H31_10235 [Nocardioidaceae bacterium]|nr:hypothetical protein [Nocardioidaceae bacterium]
MSKSSPDEPVVTPPPLTVVSSVVAVQGVILLALAAVEMVDAEEGRRALAWSTAGFFAVYGAVLLAAAVGLMRRGHWVRGSVLITQLIALGLAWNIREHVAAAIMLALAAIIAIAGMLHPDSVAALDGQSPDSRE